MFKNIIKFSFSQSVRESQDISKAGWSKKQKNIFWAFMGAITLKIYTNYHKTDLLYTFAPTQQNINAIKNCPTLRTGKYYPTFYLPSAFLQSLYGSFFDAVPYIPMSREQLVVDEQGGSIYLDHVPVNNKFIDSEGVSKPNMRVLVILHGLTGASESNYIRQTALHASRKGFRTICVNLRGFAQTKLTTPQLTNYTEINDVQYAIQHIHTQFPSANLYILGYSMGSNQMLRYLEWDQENRVKAAVGISVPWDFQELAEEISSYRKILYDFGITRNFKRNLRENREIFDSVKQQLNLDVGLFQFLQSIDGALKCNSSKAFDELFTIKLMNYSNTNELYKKIECKSVLTKLRTPVLLLSSMNDPIIKQSMIPKDEIKANPFIMLVQTQSGGHIEWFTGYRPQRWIIKPAIEFLDYQDKQLLISK